MSATKTHIKISLKSGVFLHKFQSNKVIFLKIHYQCDYFLEIHCLKYGSINTTEGDKMGSETGQMKKFSGGLKGIELSLKA